METFIVQLRHLEAGDTRVKFDRISFIGVVIGQICLSKHFIVRHVRQLTHFSTLHEVALSLSCPDTAQTTGCAS